MSKGTAGRLNRPERATFKVFADCVAETLGFDIALHRAATRAFETGLEEAETEFYTCFEELTTPDKVLLLEALRKLERKGPAIARRYARSGRV